MSCYQNDQLLQVETTCGSLLYELQVIWDEVGETDTERDRMLLELEQECLEVYRRKVDHANKSRAQLRQAIANCEAQLASVCSAMGERPLLARQDQNFKSLKEELGSIQPQLEEMRSRKEERVQHFHDVVGKIQKIKSEISRSAQPDPFKVLIDETDLSLRKLEEYQKHLEALQKEKSERLILVMDRISSLSSLCSVLGVDLHDTLREVDPSLDDQDTPKTIDDITIGRLTGIVDELREVKKQRMQRLQDLATTMLELWNLMDTPLEEQQMFQNVTCNIAGREDEITEPNTLSNEFLNYIQAEVLRLEEMKESKMKELVLKKRSELEEVCRKTHMIPDSDTSEYTISAIESGAIDLPLVLEQLEFQIGQVKEESLSRKEILEKVEKWLSACEEESWLEEYNMDENRYNAGRGAHLTLKRAEKARAAVNKLPAMVETLVAKTKAWEREMGTEFTYDGIRLLSMLEEYTILRQEKEEERRRQRDQKRLQGQLIAEQEALFGSKPSPSKQQSAKKLPRTSTGTANRRFSSGAALLPPSPQLSHSKTGGLHGSKQARKIDGLQQNLSHAYHRTDSFAEQSAGRRRGLDVGGPQDRIKLQPSESSTPNQRMPLSPLSSRSTSTVKYIDDENCLLQNSPLLKAKAGLTESSTCNITTMPIQHDDIHMDDENVIPRNFSNSETPSSTAVPMITAITPAQGQKILGSSLESETTEYSFEEKRLTFILSRNEILT